MQLYDRNSMAPTIRLAIYKKAR